MKHPSLLLILLALGAVPHAASASEPSDADRQAALEHYDRGVELARADRYQEALDEFYAAYEKSPNYAVLYNIGQAYIGLRKPAEALKTLEQYIEAGKSELSPERLERINKQIAAQRAELGAIRLAVNAVDASIEVDGRPAGTAPLTQPLVVTPGTHLLAVSAVGRATLVRSITVTRGEVIDLTVELVPLPATVPPTAVASAVAPVGSVTPQRTPVGATPVSTSESKTHGTLRTVSYVLGGVGLALEATALVHYFWNHNRYEHWKSEDQALHAEQVPGDYDARQNANNELAASIDGAKDVTVGLALGGAACLAGGVSVFFVSVGTASSSASRPSSFVLTARGAW